MRTNSTRFTLVSIFLCLIILSACTSSITVTGWKNPKETQKVSKVVVWAMFNKLEYQKPFEDAAVKYINSRGTKAVGSLSILAPDRKYELADLEKEFDNIGADAVLIFNYTGMEKTESYVPQTTTFYPDYYYSYYGYYSYGYNMYYGGANAVTTGGYWTTSQTLNLTANLYANSSNALLWTGNISVTDPEYVDQAAYNITRYIYSEWVTSDILAKKK